MSLKANPPVLVMGDFGDTRCGVGRSLAALYDSVPVEVLDPTEGGLRTWWRRCRATSSRPVIVVYPTASTFESPRLFLRALVARVAAGRPFRVYLHEYDRFRRPHRPFVALLAGLAKDGIILSTQVEVHAIERPWPRVVVRHHPLLVAPPANGAAPRKPVTAGTPEPGLAGVFGMWRPDKAPEWVDDVLARLPQVTRVQVVGAGWKLEHLRRAAARGVVVELLGHVADDALPGLLDRWALALAPFADGPHDGRLSLRTPLAYGVPTLTSPPRPGALTLRPDHLVIVRADKAGLIDVPDLTAAARTQAAANVAAWEREARSRLRSYLAHGADRGDG